MNKLSIKNKPMIFGAAFVTLTFAGLFGFQNCGQMKPTFIDVSSVVDSSQSPPPRGLEDQTPLSPSDSPQMGILALSGNSLSISEGFVQGNRVGLIGTDVPDDQRIYSQPNRPLGLDRLTFALGGSTQVKPAGLTKVWIDIGTSLGEGDLVAGIFGTNNLGKGYDLNPAASHPAECAEWFRTLTPTADCTGTNKFIYVRVWTEINNVWQTPIDYVFPTSTLISPKNNFYESDRLIGSTFNFIWKNAGKSTTAYWLDVGTSPGDGDIFRYSYDTNKNPIGVGPNVTSQVVGNIPQDRPVWARLWVQQNGKWMYPQDFFIPNGTRRFNRVGPIRW